MLLIVPFVPTGMKMGVGTETGAFLLIEGRGGKKRVDALAWPDIAWRWKSREGCGEDVKSGSVPTGVNLASLSHSTLVLDAIISA
jgi:hypothetical protein